MISVPLQVYFARQSRDRNVPWGILPLLKFGLSAILILLCVIDFGYEIHNQVAPVHSVASGLKILTYVTVLILQWLCMKYGLVTSSILFSFWTLNAASETFTFRSVILSGHLSGEAKVLPLITYTIQYPIVVAAFFLSCWSDPKPRNVVLEGMLY